MLNNKFWQGFFALAPILTFIIAMIGYFIFIFSMFSNLEQIEGTNQPPTEFFAGIGIFIIMILFAAFISLGSLIFYIFHAVKNPNLKENNVLVVWILLFVFAGGIGKLIYWIVEILNKPKQIIS